MNKIDNLECLLDKYKDIIHIDGLDNIPGEDNTIYLANHESMLDLFLISYILKNKCVVLVSANTLFGNYQERKEMVNKYLYTFPIEARAKKHYCDVCLNGASKLLEDGYNLLIFPQGVFDKDGKIHKARTGAIRILFDAINNSKKNYNLVPIGINLKNHESNKLSLDIWDGFEANIKILPKIDYKRYYDLYINSKNFEDRRLILRILTDNIMNNIAKSLKLDYVDEYNSLYNMDGFWLPNGNYIKFGEENKKELYEEYKRDINNIIDNIENDKEFKLVRKKDYLM